MKKSIIFLFASFLLFGGNSNGQKTSGNVIQGFEEIPVVFHGQTIPLRDFVSDPKFPNEQTRAEKLGYSAKKDWFLNPTVNPNALPKDGDPLLQKEYADASGERALTQSFEGMGYTGVNPADPSIDVGPNHVIQMINGSSGAYFKIWNKSGTQVMAQTYFDTYFGMPGGAGDPIVLYDESADRWLMSEFSQSGNNMHVAISTSPDPMGTWYTYSFNAPTFPDYPKYSIWNNAYIITTNESSATVYALNRTSLLAGTAAPAQRRTLTNFGTIGFQAATPVSWNGTTTPPAGTNPMVMRMRDDAWSGAASDALEIWSVNIDWNNAANTTLTQTTVLPIAPYESELCGYTSFACIPQPSSSTTLDPLREVLMNRIHYRNFGTHESIVCCHVADMDGSDHAGIRWYELRRTGGSSGSWTIYQAGAYSPDTDHRWMPSIGISATGNIGLAYNVSGSSTRPSLRYTGRKVCDPLGVMTEPETVIIAGTGSNGSNRYGDYNAMGLDPSDGETFWFTGMYNPASQWSTRVGAFSIPGCAPLVQFNASTLTANESDATVNNNCRDYSIVNVPISIGADPSQPANVTVAVSGGTATQGQDFSLNNTSFVLDGSTLSGTAELWIYNDDYVEGTETIILSYSLNANGGDATNGTINQTITVTINDDDLDPFSMTVSTTILSHDFNSVLAPFTTINNAAGANNDPWAIGNATTGSSQAFTIPNTNATNFAFVNDDACNCNQNSVDLIFPVLNLSNYVGATLTFDKFYEGNTYQGNTETANLQVSVNGGAYTTVTAIQSGTAWGSQTVDLTPYAGNASVQLRIRYSDGTGWLYGCAIDNVVVQGLSPISVQTAVNAGSGQESYLGPNGEVHFYDPTTGNVMMTISNTSNFDFGCVTVEVDRQGTSPTAIQFASANTSDYLCSKTFTVSPQNSNPSGTFNVTLYYEEAEIAAWESFTGNSRSNIEVIKVAGNNSISDVTPANYASFTINNPTATLGSFNGDVTLTASFSNGFSGFGAGIYAITPPGTPNANFTVNTSTICQGDAVTFTDISTGSPTSWLWDFGDGNTSTQQNPSHTYSAPGSYTVSLTATNGSGSDTQTNSAFVVVNAATSSSQNVEICSGASYSIGSSTYTSAGTYTDVITNAAGCDSTVTTVLTIAAPISSSQNVTICSGQFYSIGSSTYTTAGTYTDVITAANGCDSTVTTNLTVNPSPTVTIYPLSTDTVCTYGGTLSLTATPSGGNFTGSGVSGTTFDPSSLAPGSYIITYSYQDANNCTGQDTETIVVSACLGIDETTLEGVMISPNPNDGNFILSGLETGTRFEIFDARGRMVMADQVNSSSNQVIITGVESGIYFLKTNKKGKEGTLRFVISKQ